MKVILSGNTAKLYVNGIYKAQYSYSATFTGRNVGFRTVNATTYFDNFLVSAAEISRTTYAVAGRVIATRISGDPAAGNNFLANPSALPTLARGFMLGNCKPG